LVAYTSLRHRLNNEAHDPQLARLERVCDDWPNKRNVHTKVPLHDAAGSLGARFAGFPTEIGRAAVFRRAAGLPHLNRKDWLVLWAILKSVGDRET